MSISGARKCKPKGVVLSPPGLEAHIERRLPVTARTMSAELRYLVLKGLEAIDDPFVEVPEDGA